MATTNRINVYMYLLELSREYISSAINEYDNNSGKNGYEEYYKIDYHIFAFTQLLYTIKERLKTEYVTDKKEIEQFFSESPNSTTILKDLANALKHKNGINLGAVACFDIELNSINKSSKVKSVKSDRMVCSYCKSINIDHALKGVTLSELIEKVFIEVKEFLDDKKYDY